jgi:hypothetical protein
MKKKASKRSARGSKTTKSARTKTRASRGVAPTRSKKKAVKRTAPKAAKVKKRAKRPTKKPTRKAAPRKAAPARKAPSTKKTQQKALAKPEAMAKATAPRLARQVRIAAKAQRRRSDDADAFLRVRRNGALTKDDLADGLGADFIGSATSGEGQAAEVRDRVLDEESGGPFVTTPAKREFADGFDASNPEDAEREPFPNVTSQPDP